MRTINDTVRYITHLEEVVAGSSIALQCRTTGEVSGPECVFPRGVGEEVIVFGGVGLVGAIEGVQVTGRSGV